MHGRFLVTAVLSITTLAACGGDADTPAPTPGPAGAAAESAFNDADVEFAQGMIPHHEQAIEMADIALDPSSTASDAVRALATRIKAGQGPEVAQLTALLTAWGKPVAMDSSGGHDMASMEGMLSVAELDGLDALAAAPFDREWARLMLVHHQGAVAMARTAETGGANDEIRTLAAAIIAAQTAEIEELRPIAG